MRNLIVFIWKNNFFFLFLLLEVACAYFLVQTNTFHKAKFVNSATEVAGKVYQANQDIKDYLHLKETNERLAKENADLRNRSMSSFMQIPVGEYVAEDTIYKQQYVYYDAKVVNNSTDRQNNYLTLNKGTKQGIRPDMGVISGSGVVGIVRDASDNFSSVMSVLHRDTRVSSKLKRDGTIAPLSWDGSDYRYGYLSEVPANVKLLAGDTVVTSPYSPTYPEGIMVGTVESFEREAGKPFYSVKVKLSTDFKRLDYVYVVSNIIKAEQDSLEKHSQKEEEPR